MEKNEQIFNLLTGWKNLPKYQLERRADIFFALYLPEIFKKLGCGVARLDEHNKDGNVEKYGNVIPEFPMKVYNKDRVKNLSRNIDYAVFCEEKKQVYFIELKTDLESVESEQFCAMTLHQNIEQLVKNAYELINVKRSDAKAQNKYEKLKNYLNQNCPEEDGYKKYNKYAKICYILPDIDIDSFITINRLEKINIPKSFTIPDEKLLEREYKNKFEIKEYEGKSKKYSHQMYVKNNILNDITLITYTQIIKALPSNDPIAKLFRNALCKRWNTNRNSSHES